MIEKTTNLLEKHKQLKLKNVFFTIYSYFVQFFIYYTYTYSYL